MSLLGEFLRAWLYLIFIFCHNFKEIVDFHILSVSRFYGNAWAVPVGVRHLN